jgi:hypothetical protein
MIRTRFFMPAFVVLPLSTLDGAAPVLDLLFREAFAQRCGRQLVVDRLFEVVLIQILRQLMASAPERSGLFAGLAHPQLSRALIAMHVEPGTPWSLATLAEACGMSTSWGVNVYAEAVWNFGAQHLLWVVPAFFLLMRVIDYSVFRVLKTPEMRMLVSSSLFFLTLQMVSIVNATTYFLWTIIFACAMIFFPN